jgi:hypothetical protein
MTKFSLWLCNNLVSMDWWSHISYPHSVNGNLVVTPLSLWRRNNLVSLDWWNHTSFPQNSLNFCIITASTDSIRYIKYLRDWITLCSHGYQISCSSMVCDDITNPLPSELLMTAVSDGSSLLELYLVCFQRLSGDSVVLMLEYGPITWYVSFLVTLCWTTEVLSHYTYFTATLTGISIFQTDRKSKREKPVILVRENKKETKHQALNFDKKNSYPLYK